jgi:epoxyqueuosine reductase
MAVLADEIRRAARDLGFEKVGIARIAPLGQEDRYAEWLRRQYHGRMAYMARRIEERLDPRRYLAGARSMVVVAKNYYTGGAGAPISRYAQGGDYHELMTGRLRALAARIEAAGARARACVDTAPVLEKLWAVRAGLGWQGKHSNLITRDYASWVFLGEVITDAALAPDAPFGRDHCGTCVRCIDACPTRAIVAPYVVDANRCIAYLTIEHRGVIPRALRAPIGNLIFGCDICQEVCPWNKFARVTPEEAFVPRDLPSLAALARLTPREFRRRFRGSPILRARRGGFVRNVVIALGNSGAPEAVEPLAEALADADPLVRLHAAWALGRLGATAPLRAREAVEADPEVLNEIRDALTPMPARVLPESGGSPIPASAAAVRPGPARIEV